MTRDEPIRLTRFERIEAVRTTLAGYHMVVSDTLAARVLGAALSDVGGLDGLERLRADLSTTLADRDHLREALRTISAQAMPDSINARTAEYALAESEAGT